MELQNTEIDAANQEEPVNKYSLHSIIILAFSLKTNLHLDSS